MTLIWSKTDFYGILMRRQAFNLLELHFKAVNVRNGGSSLHVYRGQFERKDMTDVLRIEALQYRRLKFVILLLVYKTVLQ